MEDCNGLEGGVKGPEEDRIIIPGNIDGVGGSQTTCAVKQFQKAKGLAQGGLTIETLRALGVQVG